MSFSVIEFALLEPNTTQTGQGFGFKPTVEDGAGKRNASLKTRGGSRMIRQRKVRRAYSQQKTGTHGRVTPFRRGKDSQGPFRGRQRFAICAQTHGLVRGTLEKFYRARSITSQLIVLSNQAEIFIHTFATLLDQPVRRHA